MKERTDGQNMSNVCGAISTTATGGEKGGMEREGNEKGRDVNVER